MAWEWHGISVFVDGLVPVDDTLSAVELVANLAAPELLEAHLCALCLVDEVEIVAVVEGVHAGAMRQSSAVAVDTSAFLELASSVAVVECYCAGAIRPSRVGAVHRAARVAQRAKYCAVVEGNVGVVST